MRVVFLGTPEFAVPTLRALVEAAHQVVAVYTQPDRPKGRGNQLAASPVKQAALQFGLPVNQPERIRRPENVAALAELNADVMVVVGYGQIIPQSIIDLPRFGILNVHASLLPKYRGAAPIQWAIANGETRTGVTIMQIDAGLDTGDMLLKTETEIGPDESAPALSARLAQQGAPLLIEALRQVETGTVQREKQDDAASTYAPILKKEDGLIHWDRSAAEIYNRFLGFTPWPGAFTAFRGQALHVLGASLVNEKSDSAPGTVQVEKDRLLVACGGGSMIELSEVRLESKKRMPAAAFLNGYRPLEKERLGEGN